MRLTLFGMAVCLCVTVTGTTAQSPAAATYWPGVEWRIKFLPDRTIEVTADEASGLIRKGKLAGTPR